MLAVYKIIINNIFRILTTVTTLAVVRARIVVVVNHQLWGKSNSVDNASLMLYKITSTKAIHQFNQSP